MKIAIHATKPQYLEHLQPVFDALEEEEKSYHLEDADIVLTASALDFRTLTKLCPEKDLIYMEHGVGLQAHKPDTLKMMSNFASEVWVPNTYTALELRSKGLRKNINIVGTPKLDQLLQIPTPSDGVIAVSFHWTGFGQNYQQYRAKMLELSRHYTVIGHSHPHLSTKMRLVWGKLGIEYVPEFSEVVKRASYYLCDHSSTIYEWAALDRPGLLLDRRDGQSLVFSTGLRYEHHGHVAASAGPKNLREEVKAMILQPRMFQAARLDATKDLYPYLGQSVPRVLELLRSR